MNRRLIPATVAAVVVLALAAGAFVGVRQLSHADHHARTVAWATPSPAAKHDAATPKPKGLAASLLPMTPAFRPGPDMDEYGNDVLLTGQAALDYATSRMPGLSNRKRHAYVRGLKKSGLKAVAARTYTDKAQRFYVVTQLSQLRRKGDNAELDRMSKLIVSSGIASRGPKVPRHPKARCFVGDTRRPGGRPLTQTDCTGAVGHVTVTMTFYEAGKLPHSYAADLFAKQLDRIAPAGAAT